MFFLVDGAVREADDEEIKKMFALNEGAHKGRMRPDTPPPIGTAAGPPKEDKPHNPAQEKASPSVNYIPLQQIVVVATHPDNPTYGLWGLDIKGRLWRLIGDTWVFGCGPKASDLPPGW